MKPLYIIPVSRYYAFLGFQGNSITLAPTPMSRAICRNLEDSGEHRFHSLEHDSKMRLFKTYSHTSTLRGKEAAGRALKQKTTHEERKSGKKVQNNPANGGINTHDSYHFPHTSEGNESRETGKRDLSMQKNRNKNKIAKALG